MATKIKANRVLTGHQEQVIRWMEERNLGAVLFEGSYRFREAFRRDARLAERYARKIGANG